MLFKSKKAKAPDASAAAALIAVIALFIVLYVLLLPPEERQKILEEAEEGGVTPSEAEAEEETNILLSESPGRLVPLATAEFEKDLPTVNIQVGEEGVELKKVNSIYIKKSLFSSKEYSMDFKIANLNDIRNALLNFIIKKGEGRLIIELNNQEIFNREKNFSFSVF